MNKPHVCLEHHMVKAPRASKTPGKTYWKCSRRGCHERRDRFGTVVRTRVTLVESA